MVVHEYNLPSIDDLRGVEKMPRKGPEYLRMPLWIVRFVDGESRSVRAPTANIAAAAGRVWYQKLVTDVE
jgi:hypothetical protein